MARYIHLVVVVISANSHSKQPSREPLDTLKKAILYCKNSLAEIHNSKGHAYGPASNILHAPITSPLIFVPYQLWYSRYLMSATTQ